LEDDEYLRVITAHVLDDVDRLKGYRYSISDTTEVEEIRLSASAIRRAGAICKAGAEHNPDAVVAFVAPRAVVYGLSRMFQMIVDPLLPWDVHVWRTLDEAKAWVRERCRDRFGMENVPLELDPHIVVPHDVVPKR
jgi:hypothetical protein